MKWFLEAANGDIVEAIELQFAVEDIQNAVNNSKLPVNDETNFQHSNLLMTGITHDQLLLQVANRIRSS